ncbi:hypothetical protein [Haloterrigena alkaliphila]|uniref:Uncharacterized protein n=1 Tax=Haloterrigena alkaliphila TaxID=2816475 RepID=A0A8A2VFY2_9EURY|nr:hypothetical protein [Haloterrigena alkaliphila]QSX00960.1 hypothetical protein J0X25_08380 [Haloterrigena alkaliphila]
MIGFLRTMPIRKEGQPFLPFVLALLVVVLGAVLYLELVTALLEYVG